MRTLAVVSFALAAALIAVAIYDGGYPTGNARTTYTQELVP